MRRIALYWLIPVVCGRILLFSTCFSQNNSLSLPVSVNDTSEIVKSKPFSGRFEVDSIHTIDEFVLYFVHCIDTMDLKWGGIFWTTRNYSGIALTIVTSNDFDTCGTPIKVGDTFDLDLTPYYGAWLLRDHCWNKETMRDTLYRKNGNHITIPRESIWNQLMVSPRINGRYYCP